MQKCPAKHTHPQIPEAAWCCPKCGATANNNAPFVIENADINAQDDCQLLHETDEIYCWECKTGTTGKKFAAAYAHQQDLVPCPTCQGTGYVKKTHKKHS